jgi:hypothetical protein
MMNIAEASDQPNSYDAGNVYSRPKRRSILDISIVQAM